MNTSHHASRCAARSPALAATVAAILTLANAGVQASPRNGVVTSGQGDISHSAPGVTQIDQASQALSIDWQSFDIAAGERVQFNQPSANAVAINRILGQDPSQIHGSLSANGRVFLLNPNGMVFGATAQVNVGSLVASSLELADETGGRYRFAAGERAGAIINAGTIHAAPGGSVSLLGSSVLNQGWIVAKYGAVNLGAGRSATLDFTGDGLVRFEVDGALLEDAPRAAVLNQGQIQADGGQVLLTARQARDVLSQAVNNEGVIRAAGIDDRGGRIRLVGVGGRVHNSGTLDASSASSASAGAAGGDVQVLGDEVALAGSSLLDASGAHGGGSVLVGGSFRGADPQVLNAQRTQVDRGAVLRADSTAQGDAGQVVVWSDGTTVFDGTIQSRALGASGDGGIAEVSGRRHLSITGHAALQSEHGNAGTLLLDPGSITIVAGPDEAPAGALDVIHDAWIQTQLAASNLHIQTDTSENSAAEHLQVADGASIVWDTDHTLTLQGDDSVTLLAGSHLENTGAGALHLLSNGAVSLQGAVALGGDLTVQAGADITQSAALQVDGTAAFTTAAGNSIDLGHAGNQFGAVTLASNTGEALQDVTIHNQNALALGEMNLAGDLVASSAGHVTQTGALVVAGDASFTAGEGQSVMLGDAGNEFSGTVSFSSSGALSLQDVAVHSATGLTLAGLTVDGSLIASTAGALTQSGALIIGTTADFTLGAGQSLSLIHADNDFRGAVSVAASGAQALQDVSLSSSSRLELGASTMDGALNASTGGAITQSGALSVGGNAVLAAGGGQSITLGHAGNQFSGAVQVSSQGVGNLQNVTLHSANGLALAGLTIDGSLVASTAGALTQSGAMSVGGAASFIAGAGQSLNLNQTANNFQGAVSVASSGPQALQNVTLRSTSGLQLGAMSIDGVLTASTSGSITQSGAVSVGGNALITAGSGQSITLNDVGNDFAGTVVLAAAGAANLQNVAVHSNSDLTLGGLRVDGGLTASTAGTLAQSGALVVGGAAAFSAGNGEDIVLANDGNDFGAVVSLGVAGAGALNDASVHSHSSLQLGAVALGGTLVASTDGALTQSGALAVGGNASFTAGEGESLNLIHQGNDFRGAVSVNSSGPQALQDVSIFSATYLAMASLDLAGDLTLGTAGSVAQTGAWVVGGAVDVTAGDGQSIILRELGNDISGSISFAASAGRLQDVGIHNVASLDLSALNIAGDLFAGTRGALTQSGSLQVGGDAQLVAGVGQSIDMMDAGNALQGAVSFAASSGQLQDVSIHNSIALDLGALTLSGDLLASSASSLTQSGDLVIAGNAGFTAAAGQSILLSRTGNSFGGTVTFNAAGVGSLQNVAIHNIAALDLGALTISGYLHASSNNSLTQSGALRIGGDAEFTAAGGESILLSLTDNSFGGSVSLNAATGLLQDVSISNAASLELGEIRLSGDLLAQAAGALTQSGALLVAGDATFRAGAGESITLAHADNEFAGDVSFAVLNGGRLDNVTLHNGLSLALRALQLDGDLDISAVGGLTQSGALNVAGDARFSVGSGESIHLSHAGNMFGGSVAFEALGAGALQDVTVRSLSALELHALTLDGDLQATAGGALTQSGELVVAGTATFKTLNTAGSQITLDADNDFGALQAAVRNAADTADVSADILVRDTGNTLLGNVSTASGGSITIETTGDIMGRDGTAIRTGSLSLMAGSDIGGDTRALAVSLAGGELTADAGGDVHIQNTSGSGASLQVHSATAGGALRLISDGSLQVARVSAPGTVYLQAGGDLLRSGVNGAIEAGGLLSLQAGGTIGVAAPGGQALLVQAEAVSARAQGGGVRLQQEQGDLRVVQVDAAGAVSLQADDGAILAHDSAGGLVRAGGDIHLRARDGVGQLSDLATRQGEALSVDAAGGALAVDVTDSDADVHLQLTAGTGLGSGAFTGGGSGRLLLQSPGDLTLAGAGISIDGFSAVGLSAEGVLQLSGMQQTFANGASEELRLRGAVDVNALGRDVSIHAGSLTFESGGAGGNITLRTQVDRLDARVGGGSGLVVDNAGALTLGAVAVDGDVSIIAQQILADAGAAGGIVAGGSIYLGGAQGIGANADERIGTRGQSLLLSSAGSAFIEHQGGVALNGNVNGTLDVVASGDITVSSSLYGGESLALTAGRAAAGSAPVMTADIAINGAISSDGTASLTAHGGSITNGTYNAPHLIAHRLELSAVQAGSDTNALKVNTQVLAAQVAEGLHVQAAGDLQLQTVNAQHVELSVAGRLDDAGDLASLIAQQAHLSASEIGSVASALHTQVGELNATASAGDIRIVQTGDVRLGRLEATNDIAMAVDGQITQTPDGRITANHLQLAGSTLGGPVDAALRTNVAYLTASATQGGIHINEANDLQVRSVSAPGQSVVLEVGGALNDDGSADVAINGGQVTLHAAEIGNQANPLQTAADELTIRATEGAIYVAEQDAVTLVDVSAEGAGQEVVISTGNDGDMTVQRLVTRGGAVSMTAGGVGSLNVTGTLESNNGLVNLISGDVLAIPGLNTGAGVAVLHTVNDVTVGTITGRSILIISDTGSVHLISANAGSGDVTIQARNGEINDGSHISLTAGTASLTARSIGSADNPLDVAVGQLSVEATAGGVFITDTDGLELGSIAARGPVRIDVVGALNQTGLMSSTGDIVLTARSINMSEQAVTNAAGDIAYLALGGDINLSSLTSQDGRVLVAAANEVFSRFGSAPALANLTGHAVEVRAGGLLGGAGRIGRPDGPLSIAIHGAGRDVFLIVPAINGIQTTTPYLTYAGSAGDVLLKGYSGSSGELLFDASTAFTADTVLRYGESIVPLRNGRVAVNSDSLSAAKQALSSGVIARVNIDWAAFDPEVSLFGTLDSALQLPSDQIDELLP